MDRVHSSHHFFACGHTHTPAQYQQARSVCQVTSAMSNMAMSFRDMFSFIHYGSRTKFVLLMFACLIDAADKAVSTAEILSIQ